MSGLRTLKRTWSGPSHDLAADDDMGVVKTKASNASAADNAGKPASSSLLPSSRPDPLKNAPINKTMKPSDYNYDQEFSDVSWSQDNSLLSQLDNLPPAASASSSKQVPPAEKVKDESRSMSSHSTPAEPSSSIKGQRDPNNPKHAIVKRQLPASFLDPGANRDEKAQRTPWSRSASELRSNGERLTFLGNGKSDALSGPSKRIVEPERTVARIFLSKEQTVVYDRVVKNGKSMFFTGSAGTGKSVLLREIIKGLRQKYANKPDAIAVTASTGIAACNIGGTTLHAFAGAGLCQEPVDKLVAKVKKNRKSASRWMRTNVLLVDEISMIDPEFLDKLEEMARILRRSPKAFGGIQVLLAGDFFQLPPVTRGSQPTRYAFDAKCWESIIQEKINLTQVFRQKDPRFVNMLNELRYGTLSQETIDLFSSLSGESRLQRETKMSPTVLFPLRKEVERANAMELLKIQRPSHTYDAIDTGTLPDDRKATLLANFMAPPKVRLKMGCQVMLIKNTDEQLVNGSTGTVLCFLTQNEWNEALYSNFDWESVNPETMTEDDVRESIRSGYLSARQGEADLTMSELQQQRILNKDAEGQMTKAELSEAIRKEERRERSRSRSASPERRETPRQPVVKFLLHGASSGERRRFRTTLVQRDTWKNEQPNGEILASRSQIPLLLAWSMSVHKSQGQTIPLVKIDLSKTFEKGQAYVALSRSVSIDGLQVIGFHPSKVRVDDRVVRWYKSLPIVS